MNNLIFNVNTDWNMNQFKTRLLFPFFNLLARDSIRFKNITINRSLFKERLYRALKICKQTLNLRERLHVIPGTCRSSSV